MSERRLTNRYFKGHVPRYAYWPFSRVLRYLATFSLGLVLGLIVTGLSWKRAPHPTRLSFQTIPRVVTQAQNYGSSFVSALAPSQAVRNYRGLALNDYEQRLRSVDCVPRGRLSSDTRTSKPDARRGRVPGHPDITTNQGMMLRPTHSVDDSAAPGELRSCKLQVPSLVR